MKKLRFFTYITLIVAGGDDVDDYKKPDDEGYQSFYDSLDSFSLITLFKESKCTFFCSSKISLS